MNEICLDSSFEEESATEMRTTIRMGNTSMENISERKRKLSPLAIRFFSFFLICFAIGISVGLSMKRQDKNPNHLASVENDSSVTLVLATFEPSEYPSYDSTLLPSSYKTSAPSSLPYALPNLLPSIQPSNPPSFSPSSYPSYQSTDDPSLMPSIKPSIRPIHPSNPSLSSSPAISTFYVLSWPGKRSLLPSSQPSKIQTLTPTRLPTKKPMSYPTNIPTKYPTKSPTERPTLLTSAPPAKPLIFGDLTLTNKEIGMLLSTGLSVKILANAGSTVDFSNGNKSELKWHTKMDGAGTISLPNGGYVYVSNSEERDGLGGVYGLYFDRNGNIVDYKVLLSRTSTNCSGGVTPCKSSRDAIVDLLYLVLARKQIF